jgi:hypothetical protein
VPFFTVAVVACTGTKFPACLSLWKKSTPLLMSSALPPSAIEIIMTPLSAALALVGSPLSATLPLNAGFSRSSTDVIVGTLDES